MTFLWGESIVERTDLTGKQRNSIRDERVKRSRRKTMEETIGMQHGDLWPLKLEAVMWVEGYEIAVISNGYFNLL